MSDLGGQLALTKHVAVARRLVRDSTLNDDIRSVSTDQYLGGHARVELAAVLLDLLSAGALAQELLLLLLLLVLAAGQLAHEGV